MGASASKTSRAAGSAARKYPTRSPPTSQPSTNAPPRQPPAAANAQPGPTVRPQASASGTRSEAINLDASDPDFARSLRSLGAVQPNPTMSETSTFTQPGAPGQGYQPVGPDPRMNPAIMVLDARARLQSEADAEFAQVGRKAHAGRQFLDVYTIRDILVMRDGQGKSAAEIEKKFGLKQGVVARLGAKGVFGVAYEHGRADKEIHMI